MQIIEKKKDSVFDGALFHFQSHLLYTCIQCNTGFQGEWTECAIGFCPNKECKKKLDEYTPYICNRLRMDIRRHIQKYYQVISIFFSVMICAWYVLHLLHVFKWSYQVASKKFKRKANCLKRKLLAFLV